MTKPSMEITFKTKPNALKKAINNTVNNSSFDYTCPNCESTIRFSGSQFGSQIVCPNCKARITLDNSGFNNDINNLQKEFDNLWK